MNYKRIDFSKLGGFPVTQYALDYLQDAYNAVFGALATLIGDKVILSGMDVAAGATTNGWVSLAGEILPFVGGPTIATIVVQETSENRNFNDGSPQTVYFKRQAKFGVGAGSVNLSDFVKVGTIRNLFYAQCPVGSVIPYEGDPAAIPTGWVMHELIKGRVLVGINDLDGDFDTLGNIGGEKTHLLSHAELPETDLRLVSPFGGSGFYVNDTGSGGGEVSLKGDGGNSSGAGFIKTESFGSSEAHNNLQPYYVIGFIKKVA